MGGGGAGIPVSTCPEFGLLVRKSRPVSTAGQGQGCRRYSLLWRAGHSLGVLPTPQGLPGHRANVSHRQVPCAHPGLVWHVPAQGRGEGRVVSGSAHPGCTVQGPWCGYPLSRIQPASQIMGCGLRREGCSSSYSGWAGSSPHLSTLPSALRGWGIPCWTSGSLLCGGG